MKYWKILSLLLVTLFLAGCSVPAPKPENKLSSLRTLTGQQGGTGKDSATAGDIGKALVVASVSPLTYTFSTAGAPSDWFISSTFATSTLTPTSSISVKIPLALYVSSTAQIDGLATLGSGFLSSASSSVLSLQVADAFNASNTLNVANTSTFGGVIFATGTIGGIPGTGAGTRFMYIPGKGGAVRFGTVIDNSWDTIGYNSFAYGEGSKATAADSSGLGYYAQATGVRSAAVGNGCQAKAADSTCLGQNSYIESNATGGVVVGSASSLYGLHGVVVGYLSVGEGTGSLTLGYGGYNIGQFSTMVGLNSSYIPASKTATLDNTFVVVGGNSTFGSNTLASHVLNVSATSTPGGVMLIKGIAGQTGDYFDVQNSAAQSLVKIDSSGVLSVSSTIKQSFTYDGTNTATINKPCGVNSITASGQTATITNSLATGDYWVEFWAQSNPGTALSFYAVTSTGSFTINTNAVTVNKTIVAWCVKKGY